MLIGQNVTVIGAGIGGLTAALALSARGASVRILEQSDALGEVGAGLQISPNGVAVLDALGLGKDLRKSATRINAVELRDYRLGAKVLRLDLQRHAADQDYLVMHRADLIDLLADSVQSNGGQIGLGRAVTSVTEGDSGAEITFADGSAERASLVIGADGLHSRLRPVLNGEKQPFFTGQVAWRAQVAGQGDVPPEVRLFMGPGRHLVTYPLRGGAIINIVAVEERSAWAEESWTSSGDPADLRRAFAEFCPEVQGLLGRVEAVNLWGLFRHPVAGKWHGRNSVLLGDAAHPTLPFLAQGANMALEDAWVLADCLAKMDTVQALPAYQTRRKSRVTKVIAAANANARNYHLRNPALRLAAHTLLRASGMLAPARVVGQFDWIYRNDVTKE